MCDGVRVAACRHLRLLPEATSLQGAACVAAILRQPEVAKRLQDLDAEVSSGSPEQFAAFWKKEIEKYRKLIADAKIEA